MLSTLMDNLHGMVYCCLIDRHWTMVFVSDGCLTVTGYTPNELVLNNVISYEEITFPDDRDWVRASILKNSQVGKHFELEYRIICANGDLHWVHESGLPLIDEQGNLIALEGFIQDITTRKQSEDLAQQAEARYRAIFENASEGIYQTTANGQYLDFNPALARIYGYESTEDLKNGISDIQQQLYVDPKRREDYIAIMKSCGTVHNFESQVYRKNGEIIWITENAREVRDSEGQLLFYEGTVEDISERKNYEQKIAYQATHDVLTGLPNRSVLIDRLEQAAGFADRYGKQIAIAFLDLDHFKRINDSIGHHIGDSLLKVMADRLRACLPESDSVVRLGGDEFVILLTCLQKMEDATPTIQRILSSIQEPCFIDGTEFVVSCSIGISVYPKDSLDSSTLLRYADSAMYKAKQLGRNNFQFYTSELHFALTHRMQIEYQLRRAIDNAEFLLLFQPKADLNTGKLCGAEALIRWQPKDGPMISPLDFIPIAEETGQIEQIGYWVLVNACRTAIELKNQLQRPFSIAVNVSPRQFRRSDFVSTVAKVLKDTQVDPRYLELELTESSLMDNTSNFIKSLHDLKSLGVTLAIDDFGTGYSCLAYLKDFPVDRLKIDKAFVSNLEIEPANIAILKTIVALGDSLNLRVVAEGVETAYQRQLLQTIGCHELQGYWLSKPVTKTEIVELFHLTENENDER